MKRPHITWEAAPLGHSTASRQSLHHTEGAPCGKTRSSNRVLAVNMAPAPPAPHRALLSQWVELTSTEGKAHTCPDSLHSKARPTLALTQHRRVGWRDCSLDHQHKGHVGKHKFQSLRSWAPSEKKHRSCHWTALLTCPLCCTCTPLPCTLVWHIDL